MGHGGNGTQKARTCSDRRNDLRLWYSPPTKKNVQRHAPRVSYPRASSSSGSVARSTSFRAHAQYKANP